MYVAINLNLLRNYWSPAVIYGTTDWAMIQKQQQIMILSHANNDKSFLLINAFTYREAEHLRAALFTGYDVYNINQTVRKQ